MNRRALLASAVGLLVGAALPLTAAARSSSELIDIEVKLPPAMLILINLVQVPGSLKTVSDLPAMLELEQGGLVRRAQEDATGVVWEPTVAGEAVARELAEQYPGGSVRSRIRIKLGKT